MSTFNPEDISTLYGAATVLPDDTEALVEFSCRPISVINFLPNFGESFEVVGTHFLSSNYRSSHIPIHMLNRELSITDKHCVFYSTQMSACIEWLEKVKKRLMDYHISQYEQLKNIPIEIEEEHILPLAR